ncbi:sigma-54-dependent Fis family transcriptional regulator [Streptomyces sp. RTd22]|uniref:sigma-54-dependent Fis family transcriptional regulator n=1 Tax=Streptomyces sp. RTd22 TaxID=1841249 RepID=UPI0007C527DB|nr:helix-turn-helix domain-containing protein [Streptomyces sp. RTd22]
MTRIDDTPAATALAPVRRARERFLGGRPPGEEIPDALAEAWRRARFLGVRRDLTPPPAPVPAHSPLLDAARPVLDRVLPTLTGGDTALVLADSRCRVLWSGGAGPPAAGCDLSERAVGHHSAVLALRLGRRAETHGPEHVLDVWQGLSAVSVPVYEPGAGRPAGTVTALTPLREDRAPHPGAALAEATALAVESELLGRARPPERLLLDAYLGQAPEGRAVVALDGSSRIVSSGAARLLSDETLTGLERRATALLRDAGAADGRRTREFPVPDGAGLVVRMTPVVHEGEVIGALAVARPDPADGTAATPARTPGRGGGERLPGLTGASGPWRVAVARATGLARTAEPLLLTGEAGVGKSSLARALFAWRGSTAPLVVDAAEGAPGDVPRWCHALAEGDGAPPLLVLHAERLGQPDVAALLSLLARRPEVPLTATHTPGTRVGPCLRRLLDLLTARSVVLPPLRERVEDIPVLLPELAGRPSPGRPPLSWSLDARRALEQHSWPGNVAELSQVVREVAEHRRATGPVRRGELPPGLRVPPAARRLSGMERAERTAILEALRRHGGNKARAAESLGIGRATLYRKLRALGADQP